MKNIALHIKKLFLDMQLNKDKTSKLNTICEKAINRKYKKLFCFSFSALVIKYDEIMISAIDIKNIIFYSSFYSNIMYLPKSFTISQLIFFR